METAKSIARRREWVHEAIAEAILGERERCAKIADAWAKSNDDDYLEPEYESGRRVTARSIAAAIRQDNPNET